MRAMLQVTGPSEIGKMWGTEIAPHPIQADHLAPTHLNVQTQRRAPPKKTLAPHLHLMYPWSPTVWVTLLSNSGGQTSL